MSNVIPFQFKEVTFRVAISNDNIPWFVAKDVSDILGYAETSKALQHCKHPSNLVELNKINDLPPATKWIPESDLYRLIMRSNKPDALEFQDLVCEEILPSIRKTGSYTAPGAVKTKPSALQPSKEFRALFGIARLIGCDKNAAAISANQAVTKLTGTNVLNLLGVTHLESENQESLAFTP